MGKVEGSRLSQSLEMPSDSETGIRVQEVHWELNLRTFARKWRLQGWAEGEAELPQRPQKIPPGALPLGWLSGLSWTEGMGWVFVSLHQSSYLWEGGKAASLGRGHFPEGITAVNLGRQPLRKLRGRVPPCKLGSEQVHHVCVLLDHPQICAQPKVEITGSFLYSILYWIVTLSPPTQMCKKYHITYSVIYLQLHLPFCQDISGMQLQSFLGLLSKSALSPGLGSYAGPRLEGTGKCRGVYLSRGPKKTIGSFCLVPSKL